MPVPTTCHQIPLPTGGTLNVHEAGQGPALVCLHGFPLDHRMWLGQLRGLSPHHRVIAPDLRGFGQSLGSEPVGSLDDFAHDLTTMLDVLELQEPVVLCGLSMGGYIAFRFAALMPQRLRGLIFCDTRAAADTDDARDNRHRMVAIVRKGGVATVADAMHSKLFAGETFERQPDVVENTRSIMVASSADAVAAALLAMAARTDSTALLPSLSCPSLWLCGSEDVITPPDEMQHAASLAPQSAFVEIKDAGHMAPLEQPLAVNDAITTFMASLK